MEGGIMSRLEEFEEILKKYDQDLYMFFSPKKHVKMSDIDPRELFSKVEKWSQLSRQGLICGIMGCTAEPTEVCKTCGCSYCLEHRQWHVDAISGGTGILEKDESEVPS